MRSPKPALIASALALLTMTGLVAAPSASAAEVYPRPSGNTLELAGRGYGHGRGMSQWGAYGAAAGPAQLGWRAILAFYYPGTTAVVQPNAALRVRLDTIGTYPTTVAAGAGLTLTVGACRVVLPTTSSSIAYWRVRRASSTTFALEFYNSTTRLWRVWSPTAGPCPPPATSSEWTFSTSPTIASSLVKVLLPTGSLASYRGWLRAVPDASVATRARTVNIVTLEQYLLGVVPSEMPSSWAANAVRAQSVAARTYAARRLGSAGPWDICDTTACQVYRGTAHEIAAANQAVAATKSVVLAYQGALALTEFSAYNGGWTTAGAVPYQVAKRDPYDGVFPTPSAAWHASVSLARLQGAYPALGTLAAIRVLARDGHGLFGGRVTSLALVGSRSTVTVSGAAFRGTFGLRSTWFTITNSAASAHDFDGDGLPDFVARERAGAMLFTYSGNGSGGVTTRRAITGSGTYSELMVSRDWNGDGQPDLIARDDATGILTLLAGDGAGAVGSPSTIGAGWGAFDQLTSVADWNGDGRPDLLARESATGKLYLYRGDGRGGLLGRVLIGQGWGGLADLTSVGDWDGDGHPDVMAKVSSTGALYLYRGDGRGGWLGRVAAGQGWRGYSRLAGPGDFNGDRKPDLLAVEDATGSLYLYRGTGRGGFIDRVRISTGWSGIDLLTS